MFSKPFYYTVLALVFVTLSLSAGCFKKNASPVSKGPTVSPMIGTWMSAVEGNGVASTLTFGEDGTFVIDTDGSEGPEVTGRYTAAETKITFTTESAPNEACIAAATYTFSLTNGVATFEPEKTDACEVRAEVLELSFIKQ